VIPQISEHIAPKDSSDAYTARLLRRKFPFLLSHVWHVLSNYKDELRKGNLHKDLYEATFGRA